MFVFIILFPCYNGEGDWSKFFKFCSLVSPPQGWSVSSCASQIAIEAKFNQLRCHKFNTIISEEFGGLLPSFSSPYYSLSNTTYRKDGANRLGWPLLNSWTKCPYDRSGSSKILRPKSHLFSFFLSFFFTITQSKIIHEAITVQKLDLLMGSASTLQPLRVSKGVTTGWTLPKTSFTNSLSVRWTPLSTRLPSPLSFQLFLKKIKHSCDQPAALLKTIIYPAAAVSPNMTSIQW